MIEPAQIPARQPATGRGSEALLLVTLTVLCAGLGGLLHVAADIPPPTAALTALACLSILVAAHSMVRRSTMVAALNAEIAELRSEIVNLRGGRMAPASAGAMPRSPSGMPGPYGSGPGGFDPAHQRPMSHPRAPHPGMVAASGRGVPPGYPSSAQSGHAPRSSGYPAHLTHSAHPPGPMQMGASAPAPQFEPSASPDVAQRPSQTTTEAPHGLVARALDWSLRPGSHREPTAPIPVVPQNEPASGPLPLIEPQRHAAERTASGLPPVAAPDGRVERDAPPATANADAVPHAPASVENAAPPAALSAGEPSLAMSAAADRPAVSETVPTSPTATTATPRSPLDDLQMPLSDSAPRAMSRPDSGAWPQAVPRSPTAPLDLDTMQNLIGQLAGQLDPPSVGASLGQANPDTSAAPQAGAATPRAQVPPIPRNLAPQAAHGMPGLPSARSEPAPFAHIALIAEAVEANRLDVLLDPILGLNDRRARHFELSVRLITEAGDELGPSHYRHAAAGTGLLGRIDAAKLASAANVLQRLRSRGSSASLFSTVAGESLSDDNFAGAFADILAAEEGQATRLVLTFAQAEARNFTDAHWRAISDMARIGLKFALTDVTDLDMDFEVLQRHGFDFIKLDASVFLEGLPTPTGHIPAADICRHLSDLGLALIVGGIVAEKDLARVLGFGAILGQGTLFGGPRSVELERERRAA